MESYIHLYGTNDEFTAAYNGPDYKEPWLSLTEEGMKVNYNKPKLTAINFGTITWVKDVPATGGTATKENCTFKVYAKYDNGISVDISSDATVTGELAVPSSTEGQRHEAGQLTLTAKYSGFTATGNVTAYQAAVDFSTKPLTFNILSAGTINWTASDSSASKTIDYKKNNGEWVSITSTTSGVVIDVNPGDKIQFRGNNAQYATGTSAYNSFNGSTAWFEVEGNIMSLIYGDDFKNNSTISSDYTFEDLFEECANLVSAENLVLPATTLTDCCYQFMFSDCTSLTTAPELPAMALTMSCYFGMFRNCSSLKTAPELPAMALKMGCYFGMFAGCTSLTTAPELPANTLADNCYTMMFSDCTSLTTAPELPATTLKNYCYGEMFGNCAKLTKAPELPAMALVEGCYAGMFGGCTSLTVAPELPATTLATQCYDSMLYGTNVLPDCSNIDFASSTVVASRGLNGLFSGTKVTDNDLERLLPKNDNGRYYLPVTTLADYCYQSMFSSCENLTTAPELPATTLAYQCYTDMFNGCTSLTTAPELPATTLAEYCYSNMFSGCTSLTTAPALPATTLANYCYRSMFQNCKKLNYIKCLATNISATGCTKSWVSGVTSTGTFVKPSSMTSWTTGVNGIPKGWTVQDT